MPKHIRILINGTGNPSPTAGTTCYILAAQNCKWGDFVGDFPKRKENRLNGYDYSGNGAYFITICTDNKEQILSRIVGDGSPVPNLTLSLTAKGSIVERFIKMVPQKYAGIIVEKYVVMPNHIHILILISGTGNPSPTVGTVIGWLKYQTTKQVNLLFGSPSEKLWQRSYYDHVVRDKHDYELIWAYIDDNPRRWATDKYYTE